MRDIKFRAWDGDHMFYNVTVKSNKWSDCDGEWWYADEPNIIEQYTGLKDKNGVEIYEGDIVSHIDFEDVTKNHIVGNEDPHKWLQNEFWGYEGEMLIEPDEVEVIGNIHQSE